MGECPPGLTLDREDNSKGYELGNCRWATSRQQARNSSRPRPVSRSDGKRYAAIVDAAEDVGVHYTAIVKICTGARGHKSAGGFGWSYIQGG
jgi:hypothetical protein